LHSEGVRQVIVSHGLEVINPGFRFLSIPLKAWTHRALIIVFIIAKPLL